MFFPLTATGSMSFKPVEDRLLYPSFDTFPLDILHGIMSIWIALKLCLNISWHLVLYKSLQFILFKYPSSAKSS